MLRLNSFSFRSADEEIQLESYHRFHLGSNYARILFLIISRNKRQTKNFEIKIRHIMAAEKCNLSFKMALRTKTGSEMTFRFEYGIVFRFLDIEFVTVNCHYHHWFFRPMAVNFQQSCISYSPVSSFIV